MRRLTLMDVLTSTSTGTYVCLLRRIIATVLLHDGVEIFLMLYYFFRFDKQGSSGPLCTFTVSTYYKLTFVHFLSHF